METMNAARLVRTESKLFAYDIIAVEPALLPPSNEKSAIPSNRL